MKTVWKYTASPLTGLYTVDVAGGRVLHVAPQHPRDTLPTLWVEHDPDDTFNEVMHFECFGTGQPIPHDVGEHVGSAVCANGALVWHVYRVLP